MTTPAPGVASDAGRAADTAADGSPESLALEVRSLTVYHGQLRALTDVSLRVPRGRITAIIGSNGAGKSTLLRTIAGLHRPAEGSIHLDGRDITGLRADLRVAEGVAMVPEGRRLFPSLSIEENLLVGATGDRRRPRDETAAPATPWTIERVYELFGWMRERRKQRAWQLSGGEQQAVAIGRALMSNPRVLLLDEVSLGLAPKVVRQMYGLLPRLLEQGLTVLLVEQDVSQAVRVASHIQCLLEGRCALEGRPDEFTPQEIEAAYFGLGARTGSPGNGNEGTAAAADTAGNEGTAADTAAADTTTAAATAATEAARPVAPRPPEPPPDAGLEARP